MTAYSMDRITNSRHTFGLLILAQAPGSFTVGTMMSVPDQAGFPHEVRTPSLTINGITVEHLRDPDTDVYADVSGGTAATLVTNQPDDAVAYLRRAIPTTRTAGTSSK